MDAAVNNLDRCAVGDRQDYFGQTMRSPITNSKLWHFQTFDPKSEYSIAQRKLPHWAQAGTLCFITWRTIDSIPKSVLARWYADRETWLRNRGIEPRQPNWKRNFLQLHPSLQTEFVHTFSNRWHQHLDNCRGLCVLKESSVSKIAEESLKKFDGDRYLLTDFVIMPNHVHLIAAFATEELMLTQCESWKHYTARQINKEFNQSGPFWQQDGFDHLVRSEEEFETLRQYIADNGPKAKWKAGEFRHFSKP